MKEWWKTGGRREKENIQRWFSCESGAERNISRRSFLAVEIFFTCEATLAIVQAWLVVVVAEITTVYCCLTQGEILPLACVRQAGHPQGPVTRRNMERASLDRNADRNLETPAETIFHVWSSHLLGYHYLVHLGSDFFYYYFLSSPASVLDIPVFSCVRAWVDQRVRERCNII